MGSVKYRGDVTKFWTKIENLNIHARVTGIAWRKMIEDEIPEDAVQRLAYREYVDDGELLEAVRIVTRGDEDLRNEKGFEGPGPPA